MSKYLIVIFLSVVLTSLMSCSGQQYYGPASTFEFKRPLNSPPVYLSVLMTEKEYDSPAKEMTGLQKNDVAQKILHEWIVADEFKGGITRFSTVVKLTITRYGKIKNKTIIVNSENELFDKSVEKAIEDAEPFPIFPLQVKENEISVELIFSNKKYS